MTSMGFKKVEIVIWFYNKILVGSHLPISNKFIIFKGYTSFYHKYARIPQLLKLGMNCKLGILIIINF